MVAGARGFTADPSRAMADPCRGSRLAPHGAHGRPAAGL